VAANTLFAQKVLPAAVSAASSHPIGVLFSAAPKAMGRYSHPPMHTLKTYIVEDSPVIRDNLIATLQELTDVEVVGFSEDESNATAWLGQADNEARLVIVDIFLKQGSGLGVLRSGAASTARAGAGSQRKWVVFTNYATAEMRSRCLALGADRLFDKSTEIDGLIAYCDQLAQGLDTQPAALT
jgi:DNA-binding NarL/FixJ family response regulator